MIISPFNPLFFLGDRKHSDSDSPFCQLFSSNDVITLQVIRSEAEDSCAVLVCSADSGEVCVSVDQTSYQIGDSFVDCYTLPKLGCGFYYVTLGESESEPFEITEDDVWLSKTILIEYSPASNVWRNDVVGMIGENAQYFSFRVPGGFKDEGWEFSVENEQFVTPDSDIVELYSLESTQKTLTIGFSSGVPIWYGQMINRILTCRYVYIDGKRYARFGSSVPEKAQTIAGVNSFVFTQKLQQIKYLDPVR